MHIAVYYLQRLNADVNLTSFYFSDDDYCSEQFICGNQKCIDRDLQCDSIDHCGDYSDESAFSGANCKPPGEYLEPCCIKHPQLVKNPLRLR